MEFRNSGLSPEERFRALYQRYYRPIVRFYIREFRFSADDAEESAQEVFLRFYQSMEGYRGESEWKFFETIARNVAYNRLRAAKTQKRAAETVPIDDLAAHGRRTPAATNSPDYAEREEIARRVRDLREAIASLPAGQRDCVQLWLEEWKYEEMAQALRISLDAVKSRIRDARRLLRARLGEDTTLPEESK